MNQNGQCGARLLQSVAAREGASRFGIYSYLVVVAGPARLQPPHAGSKGLAHRSKVRGMAKRTVDGLRDAIAIGIGDVTLQPDVDGEDDCDCRAGDGGERMLKRIEGEESGRNKHDAPEDRRWSRVYQADRWG